MGAWAPQADRPAAVGARPAVSALPKLPVPTVGQPASPWRWSANIAGGSSAVPLGCWLLRPWLGCSADRRYRTDSRPAAGCRESWSQLPENQPQPRRSDNRMPRASEPAPEPQAVTASESQQPSSQEEPAVATTQEAALRRPPRRREVGGRGHRRGRRSARADSLRNRGRKSPEASAESGWHGAPRRWKTERTKAKRSTRSSRRG